MSFIPNRQLSLRAINARWNHKYLQKTFLVAKWSLHLDLQFGLLFKNYVHVELLAMSLKWSAQAFGLDHIEVYGIHYTIRSPPKIRFCSFYVTSFECSLRQRANRKAYSEYCILLCDHSLRPRSHRSIHYTVFAIRFGLRHRRHSSDVAWKEQNLVCVGDRIV